MAYVINTLAAVPMPGWAVTSDSGAPAGSTAATAAPVQHIEAPSFHADVAQITTPVIAQQAAVQLMPQVLTAPAHVDTGPFQLTVAPVPTMVVGGDAGNTAAPAMLPVTSVFSSEMGHASSFGDAPTFELPFTTQVAWSDASDAAAPDGTIVVSDLGDDAGGWFVV